MSIPTDNVRLVNSNGNVDSSWNVEPGSSTRIAWSWNLLADYQREEPDSGWHLETRGDIAEWHRWERCDWCEGEGCAACAYTMRLVPQ